MCILCVVPRRNISLPSDLDARARAAGLNVSALAQQAVRGELDRRERMDRLDVWLDELDGVHGPPSARLASEARAWVASARPVIDAPGESERSEAAH